MVFAAEKIFIKNHTAMVAVPYFSLVMRWIYFFFLVLRRKNHRFYILSINFGLIRGGRGLDPAGGGAWIFCRGEGPAGGGAWKLIRGEGPAGGGAWIFCRGEAPPGAGAEKWAGSYPGPRTTLAFWLFVFLFPGKSLTFAIFGQKSGEWVKMLYFFFPVLYFFFLTLEFEWVSGF